MFVGHYAVSFALTSLRPRRGVLAFLSASSVLPDLLMLGTSRLPRALNYHADVGLLLCAAAVILGGACFRLGRLVTGLAVVALASHLPLDLLYVSRDSSNLYARPWADFPLEAALLVLGAFAYVRRAEFTPGRRATCGAIVLGLLILQAAWDFGGGFFKF